MEGWVRLYRTFVSHGHLRSMPDAAHRLWTLFLVWAEHRTGETLPVGCLQTTYDALHNESGYGRSRISAALRWLESPPPPHDPYIRRENRPGTTLTVQVLRFAHYQSHGETESHSGTGGSPTAGLVERSGKGSRANIDTTPRESSTESHSGTGGSPTAGLVNGPSPPTPPSPDPERDPKRDPDNAAAGGSAEGGDGPRPGEDWITWHERTRAALPPRRWHETIGALARRGLTDEVIIAEIRRATGRTRNPLAAAAQDLGTMLAAGVRTAAEAAAYRQRLEEADSHRTRKRPGEPGRRPAAGPRGYTALSQ